MEHDSSFFGVTEEDYLRDLVSSHAAEELHPDINNMSSDLDNFNHILPRENTSTEIPSFGKKAPAPSKVIPDNLMDDNEEQCRDDGDDDFDLDASASRTSEDHFSDEGSDCDDDQIRDLDRRMNARAKMDEMNKDELIQKL